MAPPNESDGDRAQQCPDRGRRAPGDGATATASRAGRARWRSARRRQLHDVRADLLARERRPGDVAVAERRNAEAILSRGIELGLPRADRQRVVTDGLETHEWR